MKNNIKKIRYVLETKPSVMFAYLFGSRNTNKNNQRSDWDIAIYFNQYPVEKNPWIRFTIQAELSAILKTDAVDIIVLNTLEEPSLAFDIINNSTILLDKDPSRRIIYEAMVLNKYFDWQYFLKRHLHSIF
ncbi:MAG TPA: nucleotidyltransferase domain-containing protein [bacterium]|nr:nucleotidyltransferase domain-containing protein [bacterium]HPP29549.1 nucleotidyltransferase domain-containing protein [bacterium]